MTCASGCQPNPRSGAESLQEAPNRRSPPGQALVAWQMRLRRLVTISGTGTRRAASDKIYAAGRVVATPGNAPRAPWTRSNNRRHGRTPRSGGALQRHEKSKTPVPKAVDGERRTASRIGASPTLPCFELTRASMPKSLNRRIGLRIDPDPRREPSPGCRVIA